ncbi:MAG: Holliday junction resolvase-like protein [Candidatus Berkelbacteria bacterium Licking1014_7]|uniref:Holliday junction resolvase-like protein n=1 Tax=Candidatus Berkelbacteria bacterium Licking1014_7 TaxID=2017147 RepID=A0A554LIE3_9BACT|nr:MAG: Holliday junction resolvase-like protein [Candidatus Berkelbacteria bacterium Licking1014_7]
MFNFQIPNIILFFLILIFAVVIFFLLWRRAVRILKETKFAKKSLASCYGKLSEQFMPFLAHYPYNPQNFRFLGSPIDGVQFEQDKIILVEFKSAGSQLNSRQANIKKIIKAKQVYFQQINLK